eukprot:664410_1
MFESSNRRHFQKGLDCEAARATRLDTELSLRHKQRQAHLEKKYRLSSSHCAHLSSNGEEHTNTPTLKELPKYIANIQQSRNISSIVDCLWSLYYLSQHDDAVVCLCENGAINI